MVGVLLISLQSNPKKGTTMLVLREVSWRFAQLAGWFSMVNGKTTKVSPSMQIMIAAD